MKVIVITVSLIYIIHIAFVNINFKKNPALVIRGRI